MDDPVQPPGPAAPREPEAGPWVARHAGPWEAALARPEALVSGGLLRRLERWVAQARAEEAADQRSRERWLRQAAEEDASLPGVLADLAERRVALALRLANGRRHRGVVGAVGEDFCAIATEAGAEVLVALGALGVIRTAPGAAPALGDRARASAIRLADVLGELAGERERVLVVTFDADVLSGELRSVGRDFVTLRPDGERRAIAYVALRSIAEVALAAGR